ncbi:MULTISPECIES: hypothetical protein [Parabacteroides]|uniref:hypothetical protein n=2 Tax=Parabacteroides leei TaxID=2939491 RepID=UPI001E2990AA|nr:MULTISPECIES: hypothetical protein [Parabacteroides]MCL3849928.1 hypothetical protein [Parabacteroides leei]
MNTSTISISNHAPLVFKEIKLDINKDKLYNFRSLNQTKHRYGDCDFCYFSISKNQNINNSAGLYYFVVNNEIIHVGKVDTDIANVINNGFGKITESKCLIHGTSTFCHINSIIASETAKSIQLFVCILDPKDNLTSIKKELQNILLHKKLQHNRNNIPLIIHDFFKNIIQQRDIEIYNEFSLEHELGIYLRECLPDFKVQFERNISFFTNTKFNSIKKEIDISIYNKNGEKYAIELKCPLNGQYPEQMYSFVKDIKFMEQIKENLGFNHTYCVVLVSHKTFYTTAIKSEGIYKYFRDENKIYKTIFKPTGETKGQECITIKGIYNFTWEKYDNSDRRYYIIEI